MPLTMSGIGAAVVLSGLLFVVTRVPVYANSWWARLALLALLTFLFVRSGSKPSVYRLVWSSVILLLPIIVVTGSIFLWQARQRRLDSPSAPRGDMRVRTGRVT